MWSKAFRKSLVSAIYEDLFRESLELPQQDDPSWYQIIEECETPENPLVLENLVDVFVLYKIHKNEVIEIIQPLMMTWHKTFDLVKACLVCFCIEVLYCKLNSVEIDPGIIGKYIRLTQSFAGGENPSLVHAVTSKLLIHYSH